MFSGTPKFSLLHWLPVYYLFKISLVHGVPVYTYSFVSLFHGFPVYYLFNIFRFTVVFGGHPTRGLWSCRRRFWGLENDAPGYFEHVYCQLSRCLLIWAPLNFFWKMGNLIKWLCQLDAHRNSVQRRRAVSPELFFQSLIPQAILGFCEPWSECQPLGVLWASFGSPLAPFGHPLGSLWGTCGIPLGRLGLPCGVFWILLKIGRHVRANVPFSRYCYSKSSLPWFSTGASGAWPCPAKWCQEPLLRPHVHTRRGLGLR